MTVTGVGGVWIEEIVVTCAKTMGSCVLLMPASALDGVVVFGLNWLGPVLDTALGSMALSLVLLMIPAAMEAAEALAIEELKPSF
jgi:hypothetical protein